jgi:hypothetical protein
MVFGFSPKSYAEGVRALALPAARGHGALQELASEVADTLAKREGVGTLAVGRSEKLAVSLREGIDLALKGKLEEASRALHTAVSQALESPHVAPPGPELFTAVIQLASIRLASEDAPRADALLLRLLEFDPSFSLAAAQRSPRVDASFQRARTRAQEVPRLRLAVVGRACADGASTLLVARGLDDGAIEFVRFDRCRLSRRVRGNLQSTPADLARALGASLVSDDSSEKPIYKSPWFWVGATATAALGATTAYFFLRDDPSTLTVTPVL